MSYAYVILNRNDLADSALQILDLKPNTSQLDIYSVTTAHQGGQTGYLTWQGQHDTVATTTGGAGVETTDAVYTGLAAYLIDNVENVQGGNLALTDTHANAIANSILSRVGLRLKTSDINTLINTALGGAANSDLDGASGASYSTGSVEDILKIMAGEVYKLDASSQVGNAANAFPGHGTTHTPLGSFITPSDSAYRYVRKFVDDGDLNMSCLTGNLSVLKNTAYAWVNPAYTYGTAGSALTIDGSHIPDGGYAAGVVVYDKNGYLI